jgi:hypothetical protein
MLGFVSELTIEQMLATLVRGSPRKITAVHIHHTWRPTAGQWRGKQTVEAMRRVHMEKGWNDIAQHLTIGPDGTLWSGRSLAAPPASAIGHNGNASEGPFMIEMVGDFDIGRDPFRAPQSTAAYRAVGLLCLHFSLRAEDVRFHREYNAGKTCPGTQLELTPFRAEINKSITAQKKGYDAWTKSRSLPLPNLYAIGPAASRAVANFSDETHAELSYDAREAAAWEDLAPRHIFDRKPNPVDQEIFDRHVVNLTMGQLSKTDIVESSPESLDTLIEHIDAWAQTVFNPRVVFYAHGGLVKEKDALYNIVRPQAEWWMRNGVYPVFFVWETGFFEVFGQHAPPENAERGWFENGIEFITGPIARRAWKNMKSSAFLASQPLIAEGAQGGAYLFAEKLVEWLGRSPKLSLSLHAVGHSAGAIFLGEWLPMFIAKTQSSKLKKQLKTPIETLSFLAPACTIEFFKQKLKLPIQNKEIGHFAEFTMKIANERQDSLLNIYQGSLLYFVRNACEPDGSPILGLQESLQSDTQLTKFFALNGGKPEGDIAFSETSEVGSRFATQALKHGDFDNDPPTMNSVLRRILNLADEVALPDAMTAHETTRIGEESPSRARAAARGQSSGQVFALCIGIDAYSSKPLSGCVADAKLWAETLEARGAIVHALLFDAAATKRGIIDAWKSVCARAKSGDTVVIQYAGHGTQVPDLSGDESDRLDEAWVPYDYDAGQALVDDEIGGLIDAHTPDGVSLVLITDCCHSASNSRAKSGFMDSNPRSRFLRLDNDQVFVEKFMKRNARRSRAIRERDSGESGREIHFAGCQDNQSSYENNGHGAFTIAAVAALRNLRDGGHYAEWHRAIREEFVVTGPQVPNFKALPRDAHRAVFSNRTAAYDGSAAKGSETAQVLSKLSALEARVDEINATLARLV